MRSEKKNPQQRYTNFWDWLHWDDHAVWLLSTAIAYWYYLITTEEV